MWCEEENNQLKQPTKFPLTECEMTEEVSGVAKRGIYLGHAKFEVLIRHLNGDVQQAVGKKETLREYNMRIISI